MSPLHAGLSTSLIAEQCVAAGRDGTLLTEQGWGICMQLLFYQGASDPLSQLPNLDWYIGMMLVYSGVLCSPRASL